MTASTMAPFEDPRSVALVGASGDPRKWGWWLARGLLRGRDRREVHLVNRRRAVIDGVVSVPALADVPASPELVVLCVPAVHLTAEVEHALECGARGILAITASVDRVVGEGASARIAERVRAAGARLLGPDSLGLYDASTCLEALWGDVTAGGLAVVSQSGQLGLEIAGLAASSGLGVSRFVSLGPQLDVNAAEVLGALVEHDATRVVAVYLEGFAGGRAMIAATRALRDAGKPVLLLTVGGSDAARDAARSHTGAMTSSTMVVDAACRAAGAVRVSSPTELVDAATLLAGGCGPVGRRVAIVSDSGGQAALAADLATGRGLTVPALEPSARRALERALPATSSVANPLDLAGAGEQDIRSYGAVVDALADAGAADAILLTGYFGSYSVDVPDLAEDERAVAERLAGVARERVPVVVHSQCAASPTLDDLRREGIVVTRAVERAIAAVAVAVELGSTGSLSPGVLELPAEDGSPPPVGYWEARSLLAGVGVPYPPAVLVTASTDVRAAAASVASPYVLKADGLDHKSDAGGIRLGLENVAEIDAARREMVAALGTTRFVLESMDTRSGVVELLVGARWDDAFGPVVTVGAGGVDAEVHGDVVVAIGPVDEGVAVAMLQRLRSWPLLGRWRGRDAVDVDAAARVVAALSQVSARRPDLAEIEVNPLRVSEDGAIAVDALVLPRGATLQTIV